MGMWGRRDQEEPKPQPPTGQGPQVSQPAPRTAPARGAVVDSKAIIGPSIQVKGELIGDEDLTIEGKVEGVIRLKQHHLVIGKTAEIDATLEAKSIRIEGTVRGDVIASERVELAGGSTLLGDITAPRMMIADGARFKGSVDMDRGTPSSAAPAASRPQQDRKSAQAGGAGKPAGVS
ncbi:MAG: polymer-forming cytoskeletal protein [Acidobacteria bacterium]|nr:MAG: polymer-forming cytoskeletal protein [Acidobacteriota bacterium]